VHNNMVTVDSQKMGKSLNNFITLKQAFSGSHERLTKGYDPLAIRQLILNSHYRSPLDFSDAALYAAQSGYEKITDMVIEIRRRENSAPSREIDKDVAQQLDALKGKFEAAMNDDLNTAVSLSIMFELVRLTQKLLEDIKTTKQTFGAVDELFSKLGGDVLGIVKESYPEDNLNTTEFQKLVDKLVEERNLARAQKDFKTADKIRDVLAHSNIIVSDAVNVTVWKKK